MPLLIEENQPQLTTQLPIHHLKTKANKIISKLIKNNNNKNILFEQQLTQKNQFIVEWN